MDPVIAQPPICAHVGSFYSMQGVQTADQASIHFSFSLSKVQSKPFFTTRPMDANRADEESYSLNCKANGNPPPLITILRFILDVVPTPSIVGVLIASLLTYPFFPPRDRNGKELDFEKLGRDRYILRGGNLTITSKHHFTYRRKIIVPIANLLSPHYILCALPLLQN